MPRVELRPSSMRRRRGEEALLRADEDVVAVAQSRQRRGDRRLVVGEAVARGRRACRRAGIDDRPIAGAAAEIAGDPVVDVVARSSGLRSAADTARTGHDEAGRAEAALRAVMVDHRLLHRMQVPSPREIFHRETSPPSSLAEQQDAGIDRLIDRSRRRQRRSTTVQAPQSPSAQPSLVPVDRSWSRR